MSRFDLLGHLIHSFAINPPIYPFIHPPAHSLLTHSSSTHLLISLPTCPFIHPPHCSPTHVSIHRLAYLSITHSFTIYPRIIHPPTYSFFSPWAHPLMHLSTFLFIYPPVQLTPISRQNPWIWIPTIYPLSERGVFLFLILLLSPLQQCRAERESPVCKGNPPQATHLSTYPMVTSSQTQLRSCWVGHTWKKAFILYSLIRHHESV